MLFVIVLECIPFTCKKKNNGKYKAECQVTLAAASGISYGIS